MNKEQFLQELESRLKILDHAERQDMLSEYSQHIDMKVQSGMSEKEAIEDFGDVNHLVEEILEVYHIDPEYRVVEQGEKTKNSIGNKMENSLKNGKASVSGYLQQQKKRREEKKEIRKAEKKQGVIQKTKEKMSSKRLERKEHREGKNWLKTIGVSMKKIIKFCIRVSLLLIAFPVIILDICAVFGLGTLLILLVQGYPLIGITIGVFGGVLCCSSFILLMFSYIFSQKTREAEN